MIKIEIEKCSNGYSVLITINEGRKEMRVRSAFCKDIVEVKDWLNENL